MLKNLSPADERRHHESLKPFLNQLGTVLSFTSDSQSIFLLVQLKNQRLLVRGYNGDFEIGDTVTLHLGQQFVTPDKRVVYNLVAHKND